MDVIGLYLCTFGFYSTYSHFKLLVQDVLLYISTPPGPASSNAFNAVAASEGRFASAKLGSISCLFHVFNYLLLLSYQLDYQTQRKT